MMEDNMTYGQPRKKAASKKKTADTYYKLGRIAASIDQNREELEKETVLTLTQRAQLQEEKMAMKDMMADLERSQSQAMMSQMDVMDSMQAQGPPMPPPGMDMGGAMPPPPGPGPMPPGLDEMGSMPMGGGPPGPPMPMEGLPPMGMA